MTALSTRRSDLATLSPEAFADVLLSSRPREARAAAIGLVEHGQPPRAVYLDVALWR